MDAVHGLSQDVLSFARENIYIALLLLLIIEEAGLPLPVPGDGLILLAGTQAAAGHASSLASLSVIVIAVLVGASFLYWIGYYGGMQVLSRMARLLHIRGKYLLKAERLLRRYPGLSIVVGRLTPGTRIATTAVAGTFHIRYPVFLAFTAVAATIWGLFYLFIGQIATDAYNWVDSWAAHSSALAMAVLAFIAAAFLAAIVRQWRTYSQVREWRH